MKYTEEQVIDRLNQMENSAANEMAVLIEDSMLTYEVTDYVNQHITSVKDLSDELFLEAVNDAMMEWDI